MQITLLLHVVYLLWQQLHKCTGVFSNTNPAEK